MQKKISSAQYGELAGLFGLQFLALGIWMVPLSAVLASHGLASITPYAFATSAIATLISPLIFGAMADHHVSPVKVLRWLSVASAVAMLAVGWSIQSRWPAPIVLLWIQIYALCAAPAPSISTTVVLSCLGHSRKQFGPIRASGTFGWMVGCWLVSIMQADFSVKAQCIGAAGWLVVAAYTFLLPSVAPPASVNRVTWKQRFGWDALVLFKNPDHRVVLMATVLFSIPMAAFYPYSPRHLQHLGFEHVSAWMTFGQIMEITGLFALSGLLVEWRLKWIFLFALGVSVPRFLLCATDSKAGLLGGILLHGLCYALFFVTGQIYLDERVDPSWRGRAQALMSLMNNGIGNLAGYLGTGWWFNACLGPQGMRWSLFWGVLAAFSAVVAIYFLGSYRGVGTGGRAHAHADTLPTQETAS
ncbi:MAG TPA: MFS transporter [Verrucomicrobiae bacterium]|nr:MFS transporter [Verrucomicrobiae bacterium]